MFPKISSSIIVIIMTQLNPVSVHKLKVRAMAGLVQNIEGKNSNQRIPQLRSTITEKSLCVPRAFVGEFTTCKTDHQHKHQRKKPHQNAHRKIVWQPKPKSYRQTLAGSDGTTKSTIYKDSEEIQSDNDSTTSTKAPEPSDIKEDTDTNAEDPKNPCAKLAKCRQYKWKL